MKHRLRYFRLPALIILFVTITGGGLPAQISFDKYFTPEETGQHLQALARVHGAHTRLTTLAVTPGGRKVWLMEIGNEVGKDSKKTPAILVVANPEGDMLLGDLAALSLAGRILWDPSLYAHRTWYIIPGLNPDAEMRYFSKPLFRDHRNGKPVNDDLDEASDEDGYNDLDGDGYITQMRVKDPAGTWLPVKGEPRLLRKAEAVKGEQGIYKLYSEGLDDDGDGKYNEDGPGGTNVGINFPHLFHPHTADGGLWPGSAREAYALMQFVYQHPEIAMTMVYDATNFCMIPPKKGRKGSVDLNRIKVPKDLAKMFGADPDKYYTMQELIELVQPMAPPGYEVTESDVAGFLGLGAVVNPLDDDLKYYKELADRYKKYLKDKGMDKERLDPAPAKDGSLELWSYYQLGVPTFTMDFWTLPKPEKKKKKEEGLTTAKIAAMDKETFLKLDDDTLNAYLKKVKAPAQFDAAKIKGMIRGDQLTPARMAEMVGKMSEEKKEGEGGTPLERALLAFTDSHPGWKGFVDWHPYHHPVLGDVEIGGRVPYADNTPPPAMIDSLLAAQVPWVFALSDSLASLDIASTRIAPKGGGVYELTVWLENRGYLPFPTAMGKKNERVAPAVVQVKGTVDFLEGKDWTPVAAVGGKAVKKLTWLLHSDRPGTLDIILTSPNAGGDRKQIKIGGAS